MLDLDSPRWGVLSDAYGPAKEVPKLLRRICARPSDDDWSNLYGTVAHQGSISNAAYAAVPHVVAATETAPNRKRLEYLHFVAFVVMGYDRKPIPQDLQLEYDRSIKRARDLAGELLTESWQLPDSVYVVQSIAALSGKVALARIIEGLADQELQLDCPKCSHHLYVDAQHALFIAYADDPVRMPSQQGTSITPTQQKPNADITWLSDLISHAKMAGMPERIASLAGDCQCPRCDCQFNLYDRLVSDAVV